MTLHRWLYPLLLLFGLTLFNSQTRAQKKKPGKDEALLNVTLSDNKKLPIQGAKIRMSGVQNNIQRQELTDSAGKVQMILPQGKQFKPIVLYQDNEFKFGRFKVPTAQGPVTLNYALEIMMDTVYEKVYTLSNVYFELDKATLKPRSHKHLDKLVQKLKQNPEMVVEIAGHTDNQGSKEYNRKLSQRRAESVRDYLVKQGVSTDQVVPKGYGETDPIADNSTKQGRAKNRRVEVRVIQK